MALSYSIIRAQQDYNTEALEVHYRRTHEYLPKHVDAEKTHLNQVVYMAPFLEGNPAKKLKEFVDKRILEGHTVLKHGKVETIQKNAVRSGSMVLTGSHDKMHEIAADPELFNKWIKLNVDFIFKEVGKENVGEIHLHMDLEEKLGWQRYPSNSTQKEDVFFHPVF